MRRDPAAEGSKPSVVRIVVFEATYPSLDTLGALDRIGAEVEFVRASDEAGCLRALSGADVDLIVFERRTSAEIARVLETVGAEAPPSIAVTSPEAGESAALDAFRVGVADCVREGPDYAEVLPVVALEQIRRWRPQRARAAADRQIAWLEGYNEKIIQSINSALLVVDHEGRVDYANPTATQILGGDELAIEGRHVGDWFAGESGEPSLIERTLAERVHWKGAETMIRQSGGRALPIGISCTPLVDPEGRTFGAVAIFQDLSDIKQLQEQVLQQEKMASIGQLAAGVAHEINNPMGFIHANLYQMSEYLDDFDVYLDAVDALTEAVSSGAAAAIASTTAALSEVKKRLDVDYLRGDFRKAVIESQEGSERIRHIVRDLRDFSHKGEAERSLADVNQCVDTTANIVFTMMKHRVVLEKDYADLPELRCYPMELKQVFMNLLVNAYQSIEEAIGDDGEVGVIRIVSEPRDEGVAIRISDTGVGIDADQVGRIFDPFYTTKEVGAGTGLGLSTSYAIVKRHGGRMTVESTPGQGATFEVWLPNEPGEGDAGRGAEDVGEATWRPS